MITCLHLCWCLLTKQIKHLCKWWLFNFAVCPTDICNFHSYFFHFERFWLSSEISWHFRTSLKEKKTIIIIYCFHLFSFAVANKAESTRSNFVLLLIFFYFDFLNRKISNGFHAAKMGIKFCSKSVATRSGSKRKTKIHK
jgi:hypothetical protein